ncbi:MAG: ribosome-associated translation inhibitor RaiA [Candidatus Aminicenantes bacterium]|nr:ribosome-associated translation inhibitor RaiA [Candidatus Aminicenantes bacterium]
MVVHFTARQMDLTPEIRALCESRLSSLERLLGRVIEVNLILSAEKRRYKVEIHVKAKGTGLVVAEETHELMNSINLAFENLGKKVKKEKEKFREKKRRRGRERKQFHLTPEPQAEGRRVIRSEDYSLKPMAVEEAMLLFDLEKKDVFLFRKPNSEKWAVIYRRKDGNYGLVEPD